MKNQLAILVGVVVAVVLVAQMFTFQVRYDQVAVLATFEKAGPEDLIRGSDSAGLKFKMFPPVQTVYVYYQKLQLLDGDQTEGRTADGKAIIIKLYMTWRIDDALAFYTSQRNEETAERTLREMLRQQTNQVGRYEFRQFVNTDPSQLRLDEFERACTDALRAQVASQGYGIHVEHVGIRQVLLSESITPQVFEAMKKHQQALAEQARSEGRAQAQAIREDADRISRTILAFAQSRAQAIRNTGNEEAGAYMAQFKEDPQFAVYLRQLETLKATLSHHTTFVLDANQNDFLRPLVTEGGQ